MANFTPTPEQRVALEAPTPLLILAGAGTGKTTVLTHRIANLIAGGGARPDQILALTFADKAATEMSERLGALLEERGLGDAGREVKCSTFHAFGAEVIRDYAPLLGREFNCRVLSTPEGWQLLSQVLDRVDFDAIELPMGGLGSVLSGMLGFFSQAKDHLVGPEQLQAFIDGQGLEGLSDAAAGYRRDRLAAQAEVAKCYALYEQAKLEGNLLDYGDLLTLPIRLLRSHPEVREGYRLRFPHLFVDEYQDTNYSQKLLLMELLPPRAPIVVIGDDDQSIYGWRGAVIRNILDFGKEPPIAAVGLRETHLVSNRRSGPEILRAANRVISLMPAGRRRPKELQPQPDAGPATVGHCVAASGDSEARWIAGRIEALHGRPEVEDPTGKKAGYGVFAVLCRKRSLFPTIAAALEVRGIPYELIGGTGFFGRWEVRDILSYLRVLASPADNIALARVLQSRAWRLSDRDLFHLSEWAQAETRRRRTRAEQGNTPTQEPEGDAEGLDFRLFDALTHRGEVAGLGEEARARLDRVGELLDGLTRLAAHLPLAELVERVIEGAGYRRELSALGGIDAQMALLNLNKLVELARQFGGDEGGLRGFVEYVQYALESGGEEDEARPLDEGSDAVKVMTVHQAKGLEFPAVFIPSLAEKIFPDPRLDDPDRWDQFPEQLRGDREDYPSLDLGRIDDERQLKAALAARKEALRERGLEEERRLFYVALTRAQRVLHVSRAHWYFANQKPRNPSCFWSELIGDGAGDGALSTLMHQEEDPGFNPRLQLAGGARREARAEAGGPARRLLDPDRGAGWIARVAASSPDRWAGYEAEVERYVSALATPLAATERGPAGVSCSGLIQYGECPRLYRYLYLDRLPQRPAPWLALGTEIHGRIEALARPGEVEHPGREEGDSGPEEEDHPWAGEGRAGIADMLEVYRRSPYARRQAARVEEPFTLPIGRHLLFGRVDRLDRLPDGGWALVDFKASRFHGEIGSRQRLQLQLYALAAWRLWGIDPGGLYCHLFFLIDGHDEALRHAPAELEGVEEWAAGALDRMQRGLFPKVEDAGRCEGCDFAAVCAAG